MKKVFMALGILLGVILLVAAFLPKEFEIKQSVVIAKSRRQVFDFIKMMENGKQWQVWSKADSAIKYEMKGVDGEVGAVLLWFGNDEVGVGEQEITKIIPDEKIDFELRFRKPMRAVNQSYYLLEDEGSDSTKVTWVMVGRTSFPLNLFCFFMHNSVAKDFIMSLDNLKLLLESKEDVGANDGYSVQSEDEITVLKSNLGKLYDIKIISMPFDEAEGVISDIVTKQNLSKYVGYNSYVLDTDGEIRKINFDPNAKIKLECGDQYNYEDYFYKLSYEGQESVKPLGEFLFVSKRNPKDFLKFYPTKIITDEALNQKMRDVLESRYNLKNSNINVVFSAKEIGGRSYKFGSAAFSNYKNCDTINADFIFDGSENRITAWRIEEFGCNGGGEDDLVYVDSDLSIDLGSIIGILNLEGQEGENKISEDWIISNSSGFETSGFKIAKYVNGSFDPATESINHFTYFGCPIY